MDWYVFFMLKEILWRCQKKQEWKLHLMEVSMKLKEHSHLPKQKGIFFTLFYSFEDAMAHTHDGAIVPIIEEFDSEDDLIVFLGDCGIRSVCEEVLLPNSECYTDYESGDSCCTECCFYDEADDVYRKGSLETYLKTLKANREDDEAGANLIFENKAMGDFLENQLGFSQDNVSDIANGNTSLYCVHVVYAGVLQVYKLFTKIEDAHTEYIKLCQKWYSEEGLSDFSNEFDSEVEYYDSYYMSPEYQECCDDVKENCRVKNQTIWNLWKPKLGEWCWFLNSNREPILKQFLQMCPIVPTNYVSKQGTISGSVEPFIGRLPTFLKDV